MIEEVAAALVAELELAVGGSRAAVRGSLAAGTADAYSDVDLLWVVPDGALGAALAVLPRAAERGSGALLWPPRTDPDLARCARRRLLALRFAELPVFARVDLDVRERGVAGDDRYGLGDPAARGPLERPAASALENAIATVKLLARGDADGARGLLERGHARIGTPFAGPVDDAAALGLARDAERLDPALAPLVARLVAAADAADGATRP